MRIRSVEVCRLERPPDASAEPATPRREPWAVHAEVANPMSKFQRFKRHRSLWLPKWPPVFVKVTAEDGTWGLGMTSHGRPVAAIIEDHLGPLLIGENAFAVERCWDLMNRATKPYGTSGLACCAISALDLALWDLVGKLLDRPVYELLGGPARERIFTYATGNDVDWYQECGFRAFKLACPYGPADGWEGLQANEELVARAREQIGDEAELMLDCYMAFDVDYTVRLAEQLRPYHLRWIEEFLFPEDFEGHRAVRERIPWQPLAGGEHLFTPWPFRRLIEDRSLDVLQPDIFWVGGLTACRHICTIANAANVAVILHGGGMHPYGLHLTAAMPNTPWAEYFIASPPGIPLNQTKPLLATVVPEAGFIFPTDAPGFGLEVKEEWLKPFFG
ncbi:MAG: L-rhamnonate dehydratase [Candidatus Poribacteria bacterium]|nr:MAG: L-rhamnonate dehydratase [Candidatus Poribacteria bacterium]